MKYYSLIVLFVDSVSAFLSATIMLSTHVWVAFESCVPNSISTTPHGISVCKKHFTMCECERLGSKNKKSDEGKAIGKI